jgi:NAD(P)-dependent dehydrogenase (short-subunit alcohol dehydrogenase family)
MGRLQGKVAVITGGGVGIGHGIARKFASEGATVIVAEINPETGARTAGELKADFGATAEFLPTDVTKKDQVEGMIAFAVERFGSIDILVNNAWGGSKIERLERKGDDILAGGLNMALWPGFWSMQAAFPHMKARGWGRIINMCSLNGVNAHLYTVEYNVAKEALRALSRSAAVEWARHGICINVICPAAITESSKRVAGSHPEIFEAMAKRYPLAPITTPENDIGPVAVFLASDDCRFMTGNTLFVDGGGHINGVNWNPSLPD